MAAPTIISNGGDLRRFSGLLGAINHSQSYRVFLRPRCREDLPAKQFLQNLKKPDEDDENSQILGTDQVCCLKSGRLLLWINLFICWWKKKDHFFFWQSALAAKQDLIGKETAFKDTHKLCNTSLLTSPNEQRASACQCLLCKLQRRVCWLGC